VASPHQRCASCGDVLVATGSQQDNAPNYHARTPRVQRQSSNSYIDCLGSPRSLPHFSLSLLYSPAPAGLMTVISLLAAGVSSRAQVAAQSAAHNLWVVQGRYNQPTAKRTKTAQLPEPRGRSGNGAANQSDCLLFPRRFPAPNFPTARRAAHPLVTRSPAPEKKRETTQRQRQRQRQRAREWKTKINRAARNEKQASRFVCM